LIDKFFFQTEINKVQIPVPRFNLHSPSWVIPPTITLSAYKPKSKKMKGVELIGRSIYMDMQATTPVDPRVLDAMLPHYIELFGNPHSRTHPYGWETEEAVESAREVCELYTHTHTHTHSKSINTFEF
jgi:hypothetical protein